MTGGLPAASASTISLPKGGAIPRLQTFILSDAEDLVPAPVQTGGGWRREAFDRAVDGVA